MNNNSKNNTWNSNFGFIMATIGAAVGLGNLWKFPYTMGENGGALFLLLFLLFILFMGLPLLLAEMSIGMISNKDATEGIRELSIKHNANRFWSYFGVLGNITLVLIMSFYSIISGWCFIYLYHSAIGSFANSTPEIVAQIWESYVKAPYMSTLAHSLFIIITGYIVGKGVNRGIERYSKFMMPSLFIVLLFLVFYNFINFGLLDTFNYLFSFDFSKLSFKTISSAMGQAFFSLAVGAGCMCIYACYQSSNNNNSESKNFLSQIYIIVSSNVVVALLAGFVVFPVVIFHGLNPSSGPGLVFHTLPLILGKQLMGQVIGAILFTLFIFAALTSSISLMEPPVAYMENKFGTNRTTAVILVSFIAWTLGVIYITDKTFVLFSIVADFSSEVMLSIGALGFALFVGWVLPKEKVISIVKHSLYYFAIRWLLPISMSIIIVLKFVEFVMSIF